MNELDILLEDPSDIIKALNGTDDRSEWIQIMSVALRRPDFQKYMVHCSVAQSYMNMYEEATAITNRYLREHGGYHE